MIIKLFEEFVPISDYKRFYSYLNTSFYDIAGEKFKRYKDHDKNYNRIYFDIKVDSDRFQVCIPPEISEFMSWYGYRIIDYNKGLCLDKDGREIKIGKLFVKIGEKRLLKAYADSKTNILRKVDNLKVVISRHPYDIIGMSTNRGWTTCLDINDTRYNGNHLQGIGRELSNGSLIAYLIRDNDRNIKNPISRCLISRYYGPGKVYGANPPEFYEFLSEWYNDFSKS